MKILVLLLNPRVQFSHGFVNTGLIVLSEDVDETIIIRDLRFKTTPVEYLHL